MPSPPSPTPNWSATPSPSPSGDIEDRVHSWVSEAFPAIQAGWSSGNIHGFGAYVSTALIDQLTHELAAFRRDGVVNRVEDASLQQVTRLPTQGGDDLVVEVVFTARDWLTDARSGAVIGGDPDRVASFRQRWHLVPGVLDRWLLDRVEPR